MNLRRSPARMLRLLADRWTGSPIRARLAIGGVCFAALVLAIALPLLRSDPIVGEWVSVSKMTFANYEDALSLDAPWRWDDFTPCPGEVRLLVEKDHNSFMWVTTKKETFNGGFRLVESQIVGGWKADQGEYTHVEENKEVTGRAALFGKGPRKGELAWSSVNVYTHTASWYVFRRA